MCSWHLFRRDLPESKGSEVGNLPQTPTYYVDLVRFLSGSCRRKMRGQESRRKSVRHLLIKIVLKVWPSRMNLSFGLIVLVLPI